MQRLLAFILLGMAIVFITRRLTNAITRAARAKGCGSCGCGKKERKLPDIEI